MQFLRLRYRGIDNGSRKIMPGHEMYTTSCTRYIDAFEVKTAKALD